MGCCMRRKWFGGVGGVLGSCGVSCICKSAREA